VRRFDVTVYPFLSREGCLASTQGVYQICYLCGLLVSSADKELSRKKGESHKRSPYARSFKAGRRCRLYDTSCRINSYSRVLLRAVAATASRWAEAVGLATAGRGAHFDSCTPFAAGVGERVSAFVRVGYVLSGE
jgi:hypothetical protein